MPDPPSPDRDQRLKLLLKEFFLTSEQLRQLILDLIKASSLKELQLED